MAGRARPGSRWFVVTSMHPTYEAIVRNQKWIEGAMRHVPFECPGHLSGADDLVAHKAEVSR